MDIGHELALVKRKIAEIERSSRLSSASLDDAALEVFDDTGSLKAIVGVQADGTSGVNVVNGPVPPTPTPAPPKTNESTSNRLVEEPLNTR